MIPVITIDGPASSGKGTVAKKVAEILGFHYLDSGAIYRALGLWVLQNFGGKLASEAEVIDLVAGINLEFKMDKIYLNDNDVTEELRKEEIGMLASKYGAIAEVRSRLLTFQRDFAKLPGLVTDGRDMGSVVFPDACLKVFLTAGAEKRAERRFKQLHQLDKSVTIKPILQDIISRDARDSQRTTAPLGYDSSFKVLDNTNLDIEETVSSILKWYDLV